ncbi:hypothetical protein TU94_27135 [Streptomyces cyaneogriseus subsp. noncyanogenus]|uniref:Uncharacterized protein n=1 Tax=Streptomyces cyaneogriseus subsp. noncyanogenus TaxID=477245 RepID=A0A0C5G7A8_9ACTN|nr:hypothetical protein TU94_27135 [Streptomyces cyaneogriseus subsp. noncyanogenus]
MCAETYADTYAEMFAETYADTYAEVFVLARRRCVRAGGCGTGWADVPAAVPSPGPLRLTGPSSVRAGSRAAAENWP